MKYTDKPDLVGSAAFELAVRASSKAADEAEKTRRTEIASIAEQIRKAYWEGFADCDAAPKGKDAEATLQYNWKKSKAKTFADERQWTKG